MRSIDHCPKCGYANPHKGGKADWGFAQPEPPEQGGEQLPYVSAVYPYSIAFSIIITKCYILQKIKTMFFN